MKQHVFLVVSGAATLLLAACASTSPSLQAPAIPADVEAYLRATDAKVEGIIPGNEKTVVWAAKRGEKTPLSLVYLHGYQGSPRDYSPVLESIAPSLWLYSNGDDAVDLPTLKRYYERMGGQGKRLQLVPDAHSHMLAGDMFQPETTDEVVSEVLAFLSDVGIAARGASSSQ